MNWSKLHTLAFMGIALTATPVWAQVSATEAWVRSTVPGQTFTGAFMKLTSEADVAIVGIESPVAGAVEMHEMRMENDIARMRHIDRLSLAAGTSLELRPGGYHLMLLDLKQPLKAGDNVPLQLKIEKRDGSVQQLDVQAEVQALGSAGHGPSSHGKYPRQPH